MTSTWSHQSPSMISMGRKDNTVPQHHISLTRGILPEGYEVLSRCSQHFHPGGSARGQVESPFLNGSFHAFSNGLEEICDGLWVQGRGDSLHCKVLSVLVRSAALTPLRLNTLFMPPQGRAHRRKCRAGDQGQIHHTALLPGCHKHLEMPWGQGTEHQ